MSVLREAQGQYIVPEINKGLLHNYEPIEKIWLVNRITESINDHQSVLIKKGVIEIIDNDQFHIMDEYRMLHRSSKEQVRAFLKGLKKNNEKEEK